MKTFSICLALAASALAQNVTVPSTCTPGFTAGTDVVLYTVPYTYAQVISIIGSYQNLTWSGNPEGSVTLNGSDNTVGTARTYDLDGAHVIETILVYDKPPMGPYNEVHNTALLTIPAAGNLQLYIPYDGTVVTPICNGAASQFNFTANFCSSNETLGAQVLHMLHMTDAVTVGKFLGGRNFTSCAALNGGNGSSPTGSAMPAMYTGDASILGASRGAMGAVVGGLAVAVAAALL